MTINLTEINPGECYRILENERFGHLACCKDGQLYVAAIYFAFSMASPIASPCPARSSTGCGERQGLPTHRAAFERRRVDEHRRRRQVRGIS
ncbi:UNVERIFIED_ORG: hypothetical protein GGI57_005809 [Rhizobium aethiopicum]